jgi:hypothetical protein
MNSIFHNLSTSSFSVISCEKVHPYNENRQWKTRENVHVRTTEPTVATRLAADTQIKNLTFYLKKKRKNLKIIFFIVIKMISEEWRPVKTKEKPLEKIINDNVLWLHGFAFLALLQSLRHWPLTVNFCFFKQAFWVAGQFAYKLSNRCI